MEENLMIPYAALEVEMARSDRQNKRLWVTILVLIAALVLSNLARSIYNSQLEVVEESSTITQENDGGYNNYIGHDGDITNGETDNND